LTSTTCDEPDQTLAYARDLAYLRGVGRALRRRIEHEAQHTLQKILLVEDDAMMRALLAATLAPETYELLEAEDTHSAMELLQSEHPSLVILDVTLPDGDGLGVCRSIKQDSELHDTSVILLTAAAQESDRERGLAAGADRYITKPFSPLQLLVTIEELLC